MTRPTSIDSYNHFKASGLLGERSLQVFEAVVNLEPISGGECCREIQKYYSSRIQLNSVSPRFNELKQKGLIIDYGRKICGVTGRDVIAWWATGSLSISSTKVVTPPKPSIHDLQDALPMLQMLEGWLNQYGKDLGPGLTKIKDYLPHAIAKGRW